ncbi:MAG: response regulator [Victivallales bacterium]|nr:response regulator [Victivallales bacterium]
MKADKHRVLIVDDDSLNVEIIQEILGENFIYMSASSGEDALAVASEFLPDLILLDIMMPGMDGYEVCRRIRSNSMLSLTKIILVSARQMLSDRLDGYRAGADDYVSKPFDAEELLAKIKVFLRLKSVEEVEKIKSDLLSVFSHETKTPLHAIIGFATLLKESEALGENEMEALEHIIKSGQDMLDLIDKTILLSFLRGGDSMLQESGIQLARLVGMAAERISYESGFHNVEVKSKVSDDIVIFADEELMVTALSCLFDNAIKYTSPGTEIIVSSAIDKDGGCRCVVESWGTPPSLRKIKSMFSEFIVEDVSHHGRGHGLGMSLAKQIIEMHGGSADISVDQKKKTTRFIVHIPAERIHGAF